MTLGYHQCFLGTKNWHFTKKGIFSCGITKVVQSISNGIEVGKPFHYSQDLLEQQGSTKDAFKSGDTRKF